MIRLKVFISSVQKELREERLALGSFLATDEFLSSCTVPRIFEDYPQPLHPNPKAYLPLLRKCQIYVLILGKTYGNDTGDGISATHEEYRLARELKLPTLVCVKGKDEERDKRSKEFFKEIRQDQHTYSRFDTLDKLLEVVGKRIREHIETTFSVEPRKAQVEQSRLTRQSASPWERQLMDNLTLEDLDLDIAADMMAAAEDIDRDKLKKEELPRLLLSRGYLWKDGTTLRPTAAGALLLAQKPGKALSQARVQLDAFPGADSNAEPLDADLLDEPLPRVIERSIAFIRRNSGKRPEIVGLKRKEREEYPVEVLRELVVNAVAHRDYSDPGAKPAIELFAGRLLVSSPGHPPGGQTPDRLASGQARSRTRNPLVVQGLRWLELMDERGSGIPRMTRLLQENGYPALHFKLDHDCLTVELRSSENTTPTSSEARKPTGNEANAEDLPPREAILAEVRKTGKITTKICVQRLGITRATSQRILADLLESGELQKRGGGRSTVYFKKGAENE